MSVNTPFATVLLESDEIDKAVALLKDGKVMILPTETVYGLAADACSDTACKMIYTLKNRPRDNPLIVHCSDLSMAKKCCDTNDPHTIRGLEILKVLAPAPVTLVLSAGDYVSRVARAGQRTVAIRIPNHTICRRIIQEVGRPLAAPSANLSGMPSATNALMAWDVFYGKVPALLNGGVCDYGLESTIIDCTQEPVRILREGSVSGEEITAITKVPVVASHGAAHSSDTRSVTPGLKYRHYAPNCRVMPIHCDEMTTLCNNTHARVQDLLLQKRQARAVDRVPENIGTLKLGICTVLPTEMDGLRCPPFYLKRNYVHWNLFARHLYEVFAESDSLALDMLFVTQPRRTEHAALYDRIARASQS